MSASRVLLLTRQGCTLCAEAEQVVGQVLEEAGMSARVVDVDDDAMLRSRYTDHVPVVFVDGQLHGYWFVDPEALRSALAGEPRPMREDWLPTHITV